MPPKVPRRRRLEFEAASIINLLDRGRFNEADQQRSNSALMVAHEQSEPLKLWHDWFFTTRLVIRVCRAVAEQVESELAGQVPGEETR
jgi:hypothetical protein